MLPGGAGAAGTGTTFGKWNTQTGRIKALGVCEGWGGGALVLSTPSLTEQVIQAPPEVLQVGVYTGSHV